MELSAQGLVTDGLGKWGSSQQRWRALPGPTAPYFSLFLSFSLYCFSLFLLFAISRACSLSSPMILQRCKSQRTHRSSPTLDCFIHANRGEKRCTEGEEKTEKKEEDKGGNRKRQEDRCSQLSRKYTKICCLHLKMSVCFKIVCFLLVLLNMQRQYVRFRWMIYPKSVNKYCCGWS